MSVSEPSKHGEFENVTEIQIGSIVNKLSADMCDFWSILGVFGPGKYKDLRLYHFQWVF